ncbi:hypothetical protein WP50_13255, partial [Lactiplantibacillus plantarum]
NNNEGEDMFNSINLAAVDTPTKQVSVWMKLAKKIDWQQIIINIGGKLLEIILFILLFWVIDRLGKRLIHHLFLTNANTSDTANNRIVIRIKKIPIKHTNNKNAMAAMMPAMCVIILKFLLQQP